ncbi:hypothetical protein ELH73_09300 [Rhizobium leguminosarum]|nr:hypothetical protein ELH73_09300 [Rhizobium leguminosarum]
MRNDMRGSARQVDQNTMSQFLSAPDRKEKGRSTTSVGAPRGMRSTTFAAEVDSSNGRMTRFGTDRQHAIGICDIIDR